MGVEVGSRTPLRRYVEQIDESRRTLPYEMVLGARSPDSQVGSK